MTNQQQAADLRGARAANGPRRRGTLGAVVALAVIAVASLAIRGVAGAAVQSFSVSPSSGPPGTVVDVSGTACSPGITVTPTQDYVKISSTTLSLSTNIPVAANGSWHGSFTVPSNAPAAAGLILAVCFTNALPSLTTTYTPQEFTVTGNPATTTTTTPNTLPTTPTTARQTTITPPPTTPGTSGPGGTPTTHPTNGSTPGSTGGGNGGGGTGDGGSRGGGGSGSPGGSGIGGSTGSTSGAIGGRTTSKAGSTATAARLRDPRLASSTSSRGGNGSLWVLWLVLIALAGGAGALLWWWQHREPGEADPVPDVT
jgi:hypothetical protein